MNTYKNSPTSQIEIGLIVRLVLFAVLLSATGVGYVFVKNQQHALGSQTREIEGQLRELQAYNQVLRSEISTLTSHASITESVSLGRVALIAISDQYVARLTPPTIDGGTLEFQTASAATAGDFRP